FTPRNNPRISRNTSRHATPREFTRQPSHHAMTLEFPASLHAHNAPRASRQPSHHVMTRELPARLHATQ
ncbi:MAG: hypothetical protein IJQ58_04785, partial [Synergistaceae bacterium]|nr:hypothetical protein [Synergistaceae bacterium]